jgi:hypothetical protein
MISQQKPTSEKSVWKYLLTFRELKKKEYERERKRKWRAMSKVWP